VDDAAGAVGDLAEPDDLVVLRGQPGQGLAAEVGEVRDRLIGVGQAFREFVDVGLEPGDLGAVPHCSRQTMSRSRILARAGDDMSWSAILADPRGTASVVIGHDA
jgi:hypothetical protein